MTDPIDADATRIEPAPQPDPTPQPEVSAEERRAEKEAEREDQSASGGQMLAAMAAPPAGGPMIPGTDLTLVPAWKEMQGMAAMAVTLAGANALPAALRGHPNDVFMVLLTARDNGVALTTALREFHVIDGKVTLSPKVKLAMLNERSKREGWAAWPDPANDDQGATWHATREDRPGIKFSFSFDKKDAATAGLANKDNWKKYPRQMMQWRALSMLLDAVFPEVATGIYDPDSVGAMTDEAGEPVIDVKAIEPFRGMKGAPNGQADAAKEGWAPADDDVKAGIKRRIDLLPAAAHPLLRAMWAGKKPDGTLIEGAEPLRTWHMLTVGEIKRATAMVASFEARAKKGEWGEWTQVNPATGEIDPEAPEGESVKAPADPMQEIIDTVKAMKDDDVIAELHQRKLDVSDDNRTRRLALADARWIETGGTTIGVARPARDDRTADAPEMSPDAPDSAQEATEPVTVPDAAPDAPTAVEGPDPEVLRSISEEVGHLNPAKLMAELVRRDLSTEGDPAAKRARLAERMLAEVVGA